MTKNKKLSGYLTLLLIVLINQFKAQTYCAGTPTNCNLVCNGGFETVTSMPTGVSNPSSQQLPKATGWYPVTWGQPGQTPDLFNTGATFASAVQVPCNSFGYQTGHNGSSGYAGLLVVTSAGGTGSNKEFIAYDFPQLLDAGKIYEIDLWVSRADFGENEISNLGVWLNDFSGSGFVPDYSVPTSHLNNITGWEHVNFSYCANGTESRIVIGGFSPSYGSYVGSTTYTYCNPTNFGQVGVFSDYVYIDDVSVQESRFSIDTTTACKNVSKTYTVIPECTLNTANYTYEWNFSDGTAAVNTGTNTTASHTYTNTGSYVASVNVKLGDCINTYTFLVRVPNVGLSVTSNTNTLCNGNVQFTANMNPTGTYTLNWGMTYAANNATVSTGNYTVNPAYTYSVLNTNSSTATYSTSNLYQNTYVQVAVTNTAGCTYRDSLFMPSCCPTATNVVKYTNKTFTVNTTVSTASVSFGGTITVNPGVTLTLVGTRAQMDPNTKFVVNGNGVVNVVTSYLYACNNMWDGIYPTANGSVSIRNSRVEDAKRIIVDSIGQASITFTNNIANKNLIGINIKAAKTSTSTVTVKNNVFTCSSIAPPVGIAFVPVTPNLTNAGTYGGYTSVNLMTPYSGIKSACGIYMNNASHTGKANTAITIGGATNEENIFDKMQQGIVSYFSNSVYVNNVFQNIKSSVATPTTVSSISASALVIGAISGGTSYYCQFGNASASNKNTFKSNDNGLYAVARQSLVLEYNRFESNNQGIYIAGVNANLTSNVAHNKFVNNKIGVNFDQNTVINANILENWFDNTSAQGTYADNFAIRCTEAVLATNPASFPKYTVNNNYINGHYNGIYSALTYSPSIYDNEIHLIADNTPFDYQKGIGIEATNNASIYNNTMDYPSGTSGWWQFGIITGSSTVPKIHCNNTNYGGVGLIVNGLNYTSAGDGFYGNSMSNHGYGFWLNANGEIGDQYYTSGGTNYSADNAWTSCTNETYANTGCNYYGGGVGAKFYTRSSNPYKINNPTNNGGAPLLLGTNNSTGFTGMCYAGIATPTLNLRTIAGSGQSALMQMAGNIASGNVSFAENSESLLQIARKQLYENMKLNGIDAATAGKSLSGFEGTCRQIGIANFYKVDSLINAGDLVNAMAENNAITTHNDVDVTQQLFNRYYIQFLTNAHIATQTDIDAFESLAVLCPNVNGNAVYQARAVLFNLTKEQYVNACEGNMETNGQRLMQTQATAGSSIKLYPNPSNGNIVFESGNEQSYELAVYNLLGEKVFESKLSNKQSINLGFLPSANYIVNISQDGVFVKTERLSIIH